MALEVWSRRILAKRWAPFRMLLAVLAVIVAATSHGSHAAQRGNSSEARASLSLATQSLLPLFLKTDWTASSFSADGRFLFVVDETRSFILDVVEGRELRAAQLPKGETALWSRPIPASSQEYRWLVSTTGGLLLNIDGRTGTATTLRSFPPSASGIKYRSGDFEFEFASRDAVVVNLNRRVERKERGSTRTIEDRKLLLQPLDASKVASSAPVPMAMYFANLTSFLSVNVDSQYIALASREGTRLVLWDYNNRTGSPTPFRLSCVYDGDEKVRAISPFGRGFVVVNTAGKAFLLDPREQTSKNCTDGSPANLARVKCSLAVDIAAMAGRGRTVSELIAVTSDYSVVELEISPDKCAYSKTVLGNVKQAFFSAPIYKPSDLQTLKDAPEWNGFVAAPLGNSVTLVAGASLLRLSGTGSSQSLILNLAGRPTGAVEVESGPGFILASRAMAPLRAYDFSAGLLRTFEYDYRKYLDEVFFYNKPYAIASKLGAIAILERDGRLQFREALSSVNTTDLPRPQSLDVKAPNALCSSDDGRRLWVLSAGDTVSLFELDEEGNFLKVASLGLGDRRDVFKIACDGSGVTAVAADSLSDLVFVLEAGSRTVKLVQRLTVPHSSDLMVRPSLSLDSRTLAVGQHLYVRSMAKASFSRYGRLTGANRLVFNQQGNLLLAVGQHSTLYNMRRTAAGIRLSPTLVDIGAVEDAAFVGDFLVVLRGAEQLEVLSPTGPQIGKLVFGDDTQWLFTDGQGRFDTYDPEGRASAYWVMNDDPIAYFGLS